MKVNSPTVLLLSRCMNWTDLTVQRIDLSMGISHPWEKHILLSLPVIHTHNLHVHICVEFKHTHMQIYLIIHTLLFFFFFFKTNSFTDKACLLVEKLREQTHDRCLSYCTKCQKKMLRYYGNNSSADL